MDVATAARKGLRDFAWFIRGVMGEDAYEKYLDHYYETHDAFAPGMVGNPPMTAREFWRDRDDRQDHNPQGRCC